MSTILHGSILDTETGIRAEMFETPKGYGVRVIDCDTGEVVPLVRFFPTLDKAREYAIKCTDGVQP